MKVARAFGRDVVLPTVGMDEIEIDDFGKLKSPKVKVIERPTIRSNVSDSTRYLSRPRPIPEPRQEIRSAD